MTEDRLPLAELLAKAGDGDFLRSVAEAVVQLLMESDVECLIGAGRHERSGECQTARNRDPGSACKRDPSEVVRGLVQVANRRAPRASRSALMSDGAARVGGACLPTWASPRGWGPGRGILAGIRRGS